MEKFDAIIIGSGQSGTPLAFNLAGEGWKTALIEKNLPGGSCVNYGCTPTKTMLASAHLAHRVKNAGALGIETETAVVNLEKIRARKEKITGEFREGLRQKIKSTPNLQYIEGRASFSGKKELEIKGPDGDRGLKGEKVFINTGTEPRIPDIPGLENTPYLTNLNIMDLEEIPSHLLIIGGGFVGLEMAQMFHRFGSRVTVLQRNPQLLPSEDEDVASSLQDILSEEGIEFILNARIKGASGEKGQVLLELEGEKISGSHLLLAAGRVPAVKELNLSHTGIETDNRGFIQINQWLETTCPGIFALGDVKGGPAFTHISFDDFRLLFSNLVHNKNLPLEDRLLSYTLFTDPQLGRVGLSEKEAQRNGKDILRAFVPMNRVARAREIGENRGFMKALIDRQTEKILGFTMLGPEGGEIMGAVQMAMLGNLPYTTLRDTPLAHPTLVESLNNLFSSIQEG